MSNHWPMTWPNLKPLPEGAFFGIDGTDFYTCTEFGDAVEQALDGILGNVTGVDELPKGITINVVVPVPCRIDHEADILELLHDILYENYVHPDADMPDEFDPEVVEHAKALARAVERTFPVSLVKDLTQITVPVLAYINAEAPHWLEGLK